MRSLVVYEGGLTEKMADIQFIRSEGWLGEYRRYNRNCLAHAPVVAT